jgi:hypothetical protein
VTATATAVAMGWSLTLRCKVGGSNAEACACWWWRAVDIAYTEDKFNDGILRARSLNFERLTVELEPTARDHIDSGAGVHSSRRIHTDTRETIVNLAPARRPQLRVASTAHKPGWPTPGLRRGARRGVPSAWVPSPAVTAEEIADGGGRRPAPAAGTKLLARANAATTRADAATKGAVASSSRPEPKAAGDSDSCQG